MFRTVSALVLGSLLVACSDPELEKRVKDLEDRVTALEARGPATPPGPAPSASPEQEQAAAALLKDATTAIDQQDYDTAKAKVAAIKADYPATRAAKAVTRIDQELSIIGKPEAPVTVDHWYQGSETDVHGGKATVYVFWEVWCPHCRREVPRLTDTYAKYHDKGLQMVGITRQTKDVTDQQVTDFLTENKVTYPIAKDQGDTMSTYYGVLGIPAAAVVKDGKVVWRGHPAKLTDQLLQSWLGEG